MSILRTLLLLSGLGPALLLAQSVRIPATHTHIEKEGESLYVNYNGTQIPEDLSPPVFTLEEAYGNPKGTRKGIDFDFGPRGLEGTLYYGFVPYGDSKHPQPVYFRKSVAIKEGKASINIADDLQGRYDMVGWEEKEQGTLGFRVVATNGLLLYDGRVSFTGNGPFKVGETIVEGPFVTCVRPDGATIWFQTNARTKAQVEVDGRVFESEKKDTRHEIVVEGLQAATDYAYTVRCGAVSQTFGFRTAPAPGSRSAFTFAYASDSRSGQGGGERNVYGANYYIMKKIMALATFKETAFFQFSGDLINGYLTSVQEIDLQYANWKRAVEPYGHYLPIYISMGNHEALSRGFSDGGSTWITVDRFPYEEESAEAVFARHFVNPRNGPQSEDGAAYDPDPKRQDFPSYEENVFSYTYDNLAVIVLNSDYWYTPNAKAIPLVGGNPHAYIMDQQLAWLETTLAAYENNPNIDHVFLTLHTPFFPNGGHVRDDMWYGGSNQVRPFVAGKGLPKGIIERRDQLLELLVNKSQKVRAIMTGDEHNYARTKVGPETPIYPEDYPESLRIQLSRTIYQINNGAAGAPYYAQEETPWTPFVSGFTTQNAVVFFHVEGDKIEMEVRNPDTLELVDEMTIK